MKYHGIYEYVSCINIVHQLYIVNILSFEIPKNLLSVLSSSSTTGGGHCFNACIASLICAKLPLFPLNREGSLIQLIVGGYILRIPY